MEVFILTSDKQSIEEVRDKIQVAAKEFNIHLGGSVHNLDKIRQEQKTLKRLSIVIDGPSLALAMSDSTTAESFFSVCLRAASVICCRVSPKQKADVVALAKKSGPWVTLSIGDGANDVPMIMEAHIGVGIRGKEGSQAVRSADYAVSQFFYLQRLLLTHGRWGYRRVSYIINYYFYKNILLVFTELFFAIANGYSGQIFFAEWLTTMFNAVWTSWQCLFAYALEQVSGEGVTILSFAFRMSMTSTHWNSRQCTAQVKRASTSD